MPTVNVYNQKNEEVGKADLPEEIFGVTPSVTMVHEVVVAQLASRRSGTASTKTRSEIRGSMKKLYRQKGTGRARAGTSKNPLLRGGGVIFGPKPRDFSYKPPKKVRRSAMKSVLSSKLADGELKILSGLELTEIKTKAFSEVLGDLELTNALIVTPEENENLEKSARNIPNVKVLRSSGLNIYDMVKYHHLVLLEPCIDQLKERLLK